MNKRTIAHPCDECDKLRHCINGRWCARHRKYTEHNKGQPLPCQQPYPKSG